MPWFSFFDRIPGAGIERIRNLLVHDPVELRGTFTDGDGNPLRAEILALSGGQLQLAKIARQASALQKYPDNGTGVLPTQTGGASAGNALLRLASGVLQSQHATLDPVGMLVIITSGVAINQVRRIESWTAGTQIVGVNANWVSGRVPAASDTYELLVDCRYLNTIAVKAEYSGSTVKATVRFVGWPWPLSQATTPAFPTALPPRLIDSAQVLPNATLQLDPVETSFYQSEPWTMDSRGLMGFQVYLQTLANAGTVSLWAGAK